MPLSTVRTDTMRSNNDILLGNGWQTIAQIQNVATTGYIKKAEFATDSEVVEWIKKDGNGDRLVGIRVDGMGKATRISGIRSGKEDGGVTDRGAVERKGR